MLCISVIGVSSVECAEMDTGKPQIHVATHWCFTRLAGSINMFIWNIL